MGSAYLGEAGPTPIFLTYLAFGRDRIGPALLCCEQLGMAGHFAFDRFFVLPGATEGNAVVPDAHILRHCSDDRTVFTLTVS